MREKSKTLNIPISPYQQQMIADAASIAGLAPTTWARQQIMFAVQKTYSHLQSNEALAIGKTP